MLLSLVIVLAVGLAAVILSRPVVAHARLWRATVTPLASIIGSGFLVLGPILDSSYGAHAPLVMAGICLAAYWFGAAIRFNIHALDGTHISSTQPEMALEVASSWSLAFAYVISVAYYLNLLGAFAVSLSAFNTPFSAKLVTSAVYGVIIVVGWWRGFKLLERLEYASVTIKLAVIAGLLAGLALYFSEKAAADSLVVGSPKQTGIAAITLAFGLLITVQGFETSRYLGNHYSAKERIRSMRLAQGVTSIIYLAYITLLVFAVDIQGRLLTETAIIDMMRTVSPILPALLVAAALSAQFSAAIADTSGAGGLFTELTRRHLAARHGYALLVAVGLALTWSADVFQIISYASRAFGFYYALQSLVASLSAFRRADPLRGVLFALLAAFGAAIVVLGQAVEG